jgi:hypothetical protein
MATLLIVVRPGDAYRIDAETGVLSKLGEGSFAGVRPAAVVAAKGTVQ